MMVLEIINREFSNNVPQGILKIFHKLAHSKICSRPPAVASGLGLTAYHSGTCGLISLGVGDKVDNMAFGVQCT